MDTFILAALALLGALAVIDLFVGVSNDAVNFLNSAVGSRTAPFWVIMTVASLGVLLGATFSSGMMEVARTGVLVPEHFTFKEVIIVFTAVMVCDVLLLNTFNSLGLPTSTTVSIVFELFGGATALACYKVWSSGAPIADLGLYLNSAKALAMIMAILVSVVVAFFAGLFVQYLLRLIFSFNYERYYKLFGGIYGGVSLTAVFYFLVIKGAKGASFMQPEWISWIDANTTELLLGCFAILTVLFQALIMALRINIFPIIILAGTFSLAFAFAGNDLVNFIGVPLAALSSYEIWSAVEGADPTTFTMEGLRHNEGTPTYFLLASGLVMVLTLWFSKKAHRVIQTSINLSSSRSGTQEQFGASAPGRMIVRGAMGLGKVISQIIPMPMQRGIASRFEPLPVVKGEIPLPFDYVRASINLIVSAILIASATSLKLPLSTTYVTFMVAMGSSFADGAWDRESAVYRISGVLTVISGWFLTALSASSLAAVVAVLVFWGGEAAAIILGFGAIFLLVRSNLKTREDDVTLSDESRSVYDAAYVGQLLSKHVQKSLSETLRVLSRIHENFTADRERELTKVKASATDVFEDAIEARSVYYRMVAAEAAPSKADFDARYLYLRACTNTREVSRSLQNLAKLARDHVANRHRVGSNEITNDIGTLVADIRTLVNAREDHADVTALRNRAADVITRIEDLQRRLMEAQPRGSMTIRCCEFHLSYLLVLRELVNHYEIASLLEEQIDALARGAKAA